MKPPMRYHVLALLVSSAAGCGSMEPADNPANNDAIQVIDATEELQLSPAVNSSSSPKGRMGSIAVEKTISVGLVNSTGTPLRQNCFLSAGSTLSSIKELGSDGSLSATVTEPPGLKQSTSDRTCRNKQTIRVRPFDQLVGLAFTASDVTLKMANIQTKEGEQTQNQSCLVLPGNTIRLNGQRTASGDFLGTFERTQPIRPTGLVLPNQCPDRSSVIAAPKAIRQALHTPQETAPKPLPKPGHLVVEKSITAEIANVAQIAIFPPPPAPRCVLLAGSILVDITSAGAGVLTAKVEYTEAPAIPATNLKLRHDYCTTEQTLRLKASGEFQALAMTLSEGWFTRATSAVKLSDSTHPVAPGSAPALQALPPCHITPNRRNLRITGMHAGSGEFIATVVAAKQLEDQMLRVNECGLDWVVVAQSKHIERLLSPESTK